MKTKVCHFTSTHEANDDRIYIKECISLNQNGYEVHIVARGASENIGGIYIHGCGKPRNRVERLLFFSRIIYKKAKELNCDIYHFHDPELLPYGLKLKKMGKRVIFDCHEDVPAQILDKEWIPIIFRSVVSKLYKRYETMVVKRLDAVITATKHIAKQFDGRAKNVVIVNNYPRLDDIVFQNSDFRTRGNNVCFAGAISPIRGQDIMVDAIKKTSGKLLLAGPCSTKKLELSSQTKYLGLLNRKEVNDLYGKSVVGLLLYQPANNHYDAQPVKMFEYMAAGLPVICSDFDLWKDIVEVNECGICVNPRSSSEVSKAIDDLLNDKERAQGMGVKGYYLAKNRFNWEQEEKKLIKVYVDL